MAGICVAGQRQRAADAMLLHLADRLTVNGDDYLLTHLVGGRLACSVRCADGADPDAVWAELTAAVRGEDAAVCAGDRADGSPDLLSAARRAVASASERTEGRAVVFPGSRRLTGILTVDELIGRSAIDAVVALANGVVGGSDRIQTRDFVRPILRGGRLVLPVQPAVGGLLVPFEFPNPTPCCADHA